MVRLLSISDELSMVDYMNQITKRLMKMGPVKQGPIGFLKLVLQPFLASLFVQRGIQRWIVVHFELAVGLMALASSRNILD